MFLCFLRSKANLVMEKSIVSKILIVGGGLTGSVTASLIKHEATADLTIWEKEKFIGGRFFTFHNPIEPKCSVDLGAQYISATLEFIRSHARFYDELIDKEKIVPLEKKIENFRKLSESKTNFVAPEGTESLVQHFLNKSDAKICLERQVTEINLQSDTNKWEVKSSNGIVDYFDAVILTIPVPEVLKLTGTIQETLNNNDEVKMAMEQVTFSCRYALGLLYDQPIKVLDDSPWFAKYFPDDEIVSFAAIDNRKRGRKKDIPAILIHVNTKFSKTYWEENEDKVQKKIINNFKCLMPELPDPAYIKCIKWKYSQVVDPFIDNPGCVVLNEYPCLISGGDSYTESDFNGCITSALRIVEEMLKHVTFAKTNKNHKKAVHHH